jgi:nitroreductase
MNIHELVKARKSCRSYRQSPVPREQVITCLEAARLAPSACNSQPWRFLAVDDPQKLPVLARAVRAEVLHMNLFSDQVPVFIVVVEEPANLSSRLGELAKNQSYASIDIGLAVENLCLAATDLGLGTCIIGWYDEAAVRHLLGIPRRNRIRLIIALGYPLVDKVEEKIRKPANQVYGFNQYETG